MKTIKAHIFGWGPTAHPTGAFFVDEQFYREIREAFEFYAHPQDGRPPSYRPVYRKHTDDGLGYGKIIDIFQNTDRPGDPDIDAPGIWAEIMPSRPLAEAYQDGLIVDWSASFMSFKDPHTGRKFKRMIKEISFVGSGHMKNTKFNSPAYALSEDGFIEENNPSEEIIMTIEKPKTPAPEPLEEPTINLAEDDKDEKPDFMKALAEMKKEFSAKFAEYDKSLKSLMEPKDKETKNSEQPETDPRTAKLEKEVKRLQRTLAEKEIVTALGETDEDTVNELVELKEANEALFLKALDRLTPPAPEPPSAPTTLGERGVTGSAPARVTYEKAIELGEAKGLKNGSADMVEYIATTHPHVMAE